MIVQCAWCKKLMGEKEPLGDDRISHALCPDCFAIEMEKMKKQFKKDDK